MPQSEELTSSRSHLRRHSPLDCLAQTIPWLACYVPKVHLQSGSKIFDSTLYTVIPPLMLSIGLSTKLMLMKTLSWGKSITQKSRTLQKKKDAKSSDWRCLQDIAQRWLYGAFHYLNLIAIFSVEDCSMCLLEIISVILTVRVMLECESAWVKDGDKGKGQWLMIGLD